MWTGGLWFIIAAMFGALFLFATPDQSEHDPRNQTGTDGIVMLSATWCGYCDALRQDLDGMGVAYKELDIDGVGADAYDAVNARGVPVLIVGQHVIYGYDPNRARDLIATARQTTSNR